MQIREVQKRTGQDTRQRILPSGKSVRKVRTKSHAHTANLLCGRHARKDTSRERQKRLVGREAGWHIISKARVQNCLADRAQGAMRRFFFCHGAHSVIVRLTTRKKNQ
jgi:hypothetical protein